MKNIHKLSFVVLLVSVLCFSFGAAVFGQYIGNVSVQTNSATNISNYQATLNGNLSIPYISNSNYVYFQWGTTADYNNETSHQSVDYSQSFMQNIENLNSDTTYHFRAVATGNYGTIYGQDMTFTTSRFANGNNNGNGSLSVQKQVINITSGNLNWSASVNANPADILSFAVILQPNGQDVHNVIVRDILPASLIYRGNIIVNTNSNYGGNITSGVNIGTVSANQPIVVAYQAQVAAAGNFSYGTITLTNNATVTSSEAGTQTGSATVIVNRSQVYGASTVASSVSTGLTNNFLTDSFLLPLLLIILGAWLYFSGSVYKFADWLKKKV